jgi:hypothetical protein
MAVHIHVSGSFRVAAPPAEAFRFFTPDGERLWVPGWEPEYLHPADGTFGAGLTFRTRHGGELTLWLVSRCDAAAGTIEYVRVTPDSRLGTIAVALARAAEDVTAASVTYRLTALSTDGERKLDAFAAEFDSMLASWERLIDAVIARDDRRARTN